MTSAESLQAEGRTAAHQYRGASQWRQLGAIDKASNLVALAADVPHDRILEIGAGEGALLARLADLRFGSELSALEISESGVRATEARQIPGLVETRTFDGERVPYDDHAFDLVVLSHVLEHAEQPRRLLCEAARVAKRVFVEVPLEETWRLPRHYTPNAVGHINFYSPKSLRRFAETCGVRVTRERVTNPSLATYQARGGGARATIAWATKQALLSALRPLATRVFTYHGCLLCEAQTDR